MAMTKSEARERIEKLRREIDHHRYLKHVLDRQEISDVAEDSLKHELAALEDEFPDLVTPDSPTQRVAGKALAKFKKVRHRVRMLSLHDAFSPEELRAWEGRLSKLLPLKRWDYFAEAKGDGFAVSLRYESGLFRRGATRGDGLMGEDVTANLRTIDSIPLRIRDDAAALGKMEHSIAKILDDFPQVRKALTHLPARIEVRGEVYITKAAFDAVNRERRKKVCRFLPILGTSPPVPCGSWIRG